ncbi:hypothetical protein GQ53DRAFT_872713 [Thozetella sp. PMI_491]|nr:hypothetical protein GQ53DRAFT_872713 [Thozetella sp. PMI_491]
MALNMRFLASLVFTGAIPRAALAQVFVASNGTAPNSTVPNSAAVNKLSAPPGLSPSCAATFDQTVACDPLLWALTKNAMSFPDPTYLNHMCTSACTDSLQALRKMQLGSCSGSDKITVDSTIYPATYITDRLLYANSYVCLQDSSGDYCFNAYNSNNGTSKQLCSDCNLKTWQAVLNSQFGWNDALAANYSSMTKSCQVTSLPVASPSAYALGSVHKVAQANAAQYTPSPLFSDPCMNPGAPSTCFTTYPTAHLTSWPNITRAGAKVLAAALATGTAPALPDFTDPSTLPLAQGTLANCSVYDTYTDLTDVPPDADWLQCCNPNYCFLKADVWNIDFASLTTWNPSLSFDPNNDASYTSCSFQPGFRYCVKN